MRHPHHTPYAIVLLPLLLLPLAVGFTRLHMRESASAYRVATENAREELLRIDAEFRMAQRAYTLLRTGKATIISVPELPRYAEQQFDSVFTENAYLEERLQSIREGMDMLSARLAAFGTKAVHIDLSEQMATLIERGTIVARYPVSSGAADTPTPVGSFQIHRKQNLRISNLETPYRMPNYMAFTESASHGLHALPYLGDIATNSDYWHEARSHIGIPVSHGCVRLLPEDAKQVYEWVDVGTTVQISV